MNAHPAADIFPLMRDDEFAALKADIELHGVREPVWTWRGLMLDGRHRERACKELKAPCPTREWAGDEDGIDDFVVSLNSKRRDLDASQRAAAAIKIEARAAIRAKERMAAGGGDKKSGKAQMPYPVADPGQARDEAAAAMNVSARYVSDAKALQKNDPGLFEKVAAGEITITKAKRQIKERKREQRRAENAAAVQRAPTVEQATKRARFATIVIDPPWDWGDEGDIDQLGRATPTFNTMSFEQLRALDVDARADVDCHLYLWITNRSLPKGFVLMQAWGFRYVTCLTWCKPNFGMGNYFRGQTEHALFGVKGSQTLKRKDVGTFFSAPRGPRGHSSKPAEFYSLVESCSPGPYLEMFARDKREGWTVWGAEVEPVAA